MKITHPNINISFPLDQINFRLLNIINCHFKKSIPDHSHGSNSYEIHYIYEGYGKVKINGIFYDLKPGTLYITGPHVGHAQIPCSEDPMCEYCVYLEATHEKNKRKKCDIGSIAELFTSNPFWLGEDTQNVLTIMQQLFFEIEHQLLGYEESIVSLLRQLIISIVRNYKEIKSLSRNFTHLTFTDNKPLLIEEYFLYEYNNLSLEDLSSRLNLSPRQTERYLKEHYGKTFIQKKTESKMATAALLLSDKNLSITDISDDLGYSSIEHFSTAFKRYYGLSPSTYRKKL